MYKTKGYLLILLSSLFFGSYGVWSKLIGAGMSPFFQGWTRGLIIGILLLPILIAKKLIVPIKKEDRGWLAVFLIFTSLTQAPLFYAYTHMAIGSATLLFFVSMLLTMYIVGILFLGEKITTIKVISFALALIGMYLIFSFSIALFAVFAALMAILNGVASGGEVSFSKKLSNSYSPLYITWLSWIIIVLTNAPISLILGESSTAFSFNSTWFWQLCYSLASLLGFWLIIEGLKHVEAGIGGLLGLLEIVFSIAFGMIIFGEELSVQILLGSIFIIIATALPHVKDMLTPKRI